MKLFWPKTEKPKSRRKFNPNFSYNFFLNHQKKGRISQFFEWNGIFFGKRNSNFKRKFRKIEEKNGFSVFRPKKGFQHWFQI